MGGFNLGVFASKQAAFMAGFWMPQCGRHMETRFLYAAAPVLSGAKPAALIPLQTNCLAAWEKRQKLLRKATGLRAFEIRTWNASALLLIYDETALRIILQDARTIALLSGYGYPEKCDSEAMLRHLQLRFSNTEFPHEIGVFLGYPIEDVWGFIVNEGRNALSCRYWKVYHDVERAQEIFRRIDDAQRHAMEVLRKPKPIHIAAKLLKAV
jgi:hypothetical protein